MTADQFFNVLLPGLVVYLQKAKESGKKHVKKIQMENTRIRIHDEKHQDLLFNIFYQNVTFNVIKERKL